MISIFLWLACATPEPTSAPTPSPTEEPAEETAPSGESLYGLDLPLFGASGASLKMDLYRGHPTLVSMFYTHCSQACPMLIARLQGIESQLTAEERSATRVLLISMDPDHDTPEQLQASLTEHHVDRSRWTFARPRSTDVRMIAALLGIRYRQLPDGSFSHSSVITLLDGEGKPTGRLEGLASDDATVIATIRGQL